MLALLSALVIAGTVERQSIRATIDPAAHSIEWSAELTVIDGGTCVFELSDRMKVIVVTREDMVLPFRVRSTSGGVQRIEFDGGVGSGQISTTIHASGRFEQDVAAGEKPGAIHNFSVDATISPEGVFLSDGSAWHPRPLDERGRAVPHRMLLRLTPVEGWSFVASGNPSGEQALERACWVWSASRPLDGMALVGNRHELHGVVHQTAAGPVEIVMHTSAENAAKASMYLDAAKTYLDLYVPLLGAYPYQRFSIVENFFSSGFACPGFTLLGPQVVAMAPRSLAPGYLDHELLHNWWGNGVYVDPTDGNWCEALTSYGANYWRRVADGGADAGRAYRRDVMMKLSTDPATLDNGALGTFGSANPAVPGPDRFVGYDKGSVVFFMLGDLMAQAAGEKDDPRQATLWRGLRIFAERNLGKAATWKDIQSACEAALPDRPAGWLNAFFAHWVRGEARPTTMVAGGSASWEAFVRQIPAGASVPPERRVDEARSRFEIDPDFRVYRVLPVNQLVPTIAGTTGPGGLRVTTEESRSEVTSFAPQLEPRDDGENVVLIGAAAISKHAELLKRCDDAIEVTATGFRLGGKEWTSATNAVLHTMHHPDRPGRFITVFHSNAEAGWSRLRMIRFYTRDTSIVWDGEKVSERRVHEPERWLPLASTSN